MSAEQVCRGQAVAAWRLLVHLQGAQKRARMARRGNTPVGQQVVDTGVFWAVTGAPGFLTFLFFLGRILGTVLFGAYALVMLLAWGACAAIRAVR